MWVQCFSKSVYGMSCVHTHQYLTNLPNVADQLPGVVGRHTNQVRTAGLVDPLAGEVESRRHL